ncbi:hypothetical protein [Neisseria mucosa]|uniref:hypothetical protein n=1 Tax=Neisseria mucosa TaxID=488 RepID=UPI000697C344|nr:hypothetical protein [Neisseria mucosa]
MTTNSTAKDMAGMKVEGVGTDGNESLYGWDTADVLDGGKGNDYLSGYNGDDLLKGGKATTAFTAAKALTRWKVMRAMIT